MKKIFLFLAVIAMFLASCEDTSKYKVQYSGVKAIVEAPYGYIPGDTIVASVKCGSIYVTKKCVIVREIQE